MGFHSRFDSRFHSGFSGVALLALLSACGSSGSNLPDAAPADAAPAVRDWDRDILSMSLDVDVTTRHATATIALAPSASNGASFEIGDLSITAVRDVSAAGDSANRSLIFTAADSTLDIGVPSSTSALRLQIEYDYVLHDMLDGALASGVTLLWPYYCGNLFPCKSDPADGLEVNLSLTGVPDGDTAVFPAKIPTDAPSYMMAWAVGDYTFMELGTTASGIKVGAWYLPGERDAATAGTAYLLAAFEWFEATFGAYPFGTSGDTVASVSAPWGAGAFGGMEHHPLWHIASAAMNSPEVHVHEAAHGWFGNGIRIACWEDFVLSEGTVAYLTVRALEAVAGTEVSDPVWQSYGRRLQRARSLIAWPDSCGVVDIIKDRLFTDAPYMKGAHFYRALERKIGRTALDAVLRSFFQQNVGRAARMQDLLDLVSSETGYDPTACATAWLRETTVPAENICP